MKAYYLVCLFFKENMENIEIVKAYQKSKKNKIILIFILLFLIVLVSFINLNVGSANLSMLDVLKALFNSGEESNVIIIYNIRLPRIITAIVAGFGLAISGTIMQGVLKNPMASPSTLGTSNGAVLGANIAIILLGVSNLSSKFSPYLTSILAFICSIIALFLILLLASRKKYSTETIVLAGVTLGMFFQALTILIQYFADDSQLSLAIFWTFGDLGNATYQEIIIMTIIIVISLIIFYIFSWHYNILTSGEDVASSLGIKVVRTKIISLILASLICATCVSFLGIIGFVGLLAPHIAKKLIGQDHRYLIIISGLIGSVILLLADFIAKILISGLVLPIGAITSIFGVPILLYLLFKKKREM